MMEELDTETDLEIRRILINGAYIGKFSGGGHLINQSKLMSRPFEATKPCKRSSYSNIQGDERGRRWTPVLRLFWYHGTLVPTMVETRNAQIAAEF
jgi:hypothetical protein